MQIASSRNPPKRLRSNFVLPEYAVGIPRLQAREDVNEEVFKLIESTQGAAILALINFSMIRWIRAENIHLLRFL
jgi:hypothetical protein